MASNIADKDSKLYALINYEDNYVQPLILAALKKRLPASSYQPIHSLSNLPSPTSQILQFVQYEAIDFDHLMSHSPTSLANAYIIRKALIRKHYLSTTIANWIVKHPASVLKRHVKPSVEFEVDYAEFLDDALIEAWELKESWERSGEEKEEREWWILKPGMSERGQGIRLFSNEEELVRIFEEWDPPSDDEDDEGEDEDEEDARSADGEALGSQAIWSKKDEKASKKEDSSTGIMTNQLRHFIAQPYIHPPLLLHPPTNPSSPSTSKSPDASQALRKFHIRTYILAVGALKVYVYKPMLALFAARPYIPPWSSSLEDHLEEALKAHLTNTCLQDTNEREGSVGLFWDLPDAIPTQPSFSSSGTSGPSIQSEGWKENVFRQICAITGETFEAAARSMSIHFQPLPNAFELFGLDFMVSLEADGELRTWLLEVNAFPDFRQTGSELKCVVEGLFEGVVDVGIRPFFGFEMPQNESMVQALDIDLGRR